MIIVGVVVVDHGGNVDVDKYGVVEVIAIDV